MKIPKIRLDKRKEVTAIRPHSRSQILQRIGATRAWAYTRGTNIRVAVIDTGLDYSHRDLANRAAHGFNVLEPRLPPYDDNGHGTHIAGAIAAHSRTSGTIGVAPETTIYPVKAFDYNGSATIPDIVSGIAWCIENRMDVINMSFGMRQTNKALRDVIRRAYHAGIIIIASAGNDGKRRTDYPARYPEVIAVGATSHRRTRLKMSNFGRNVDVYAPGEKVRSTWLNNGYQVLSGTSMAAAYVSGAAALLLSVQPSLKPRRVRKLLQVTQSPASPSAGRGRAGVHPELHIWRCLKRLMRSRRRHIRSGAETPIKRRTLRNTVRMQPTRARRA